jgi:hypothetical protein
MLGKFVWEVDDLPVDEYDNWYLYLQWKNEQEEKARKKQSPKKGMKTRVL